MSGSLDVVESAGDTDLRCGDEVGNKLGEGGLDPVDDVLQEVFDDKTETESEGDGYASRATVGARDVVRVR